MSFKDYLEKKKIDPANFAKSEPALFKKLKEYFVQVHPESFTMQKKFLINDLRRKYHYSGPEPEPQKKPDKPAIKKAGVKIKPKFKRS